MELNFVEKFVNYIYLNIFLFVEELNYIALNKFTLELQYFVHN